MSCANTLTRSAAINGNDRMSCPGREEHTDPLSSIDRKRPPALIATLHIQPGRLVCLGCHSGQGKHLAGPQALTGGSQRNSAGLRRSDLPAGWSAMQRGQSLPWRAPSKTCGLAPNLTSPQHPPGVISTPPSEFSSSPLPSANESSSSIKIIYLISCLDLLPHAVPHPIGNLSHEPDLKACHDLACLSCGGGGAGFCFISGRLQKMGGRLLSKGVGQATRRILRHALERRTVTNS